MKLISPSRIIYYAFKLTLLPILYISLVTQPILLINDLVLIGNYRKVLFKPSKWEDLSQLPYSPHIGPTTNLAFGFGIVAVIYNTLLMASIVDSRIRHSLGAGSWFFIVGAEVVQGGVYLALVLLRLDYLPRPLHTCWKQGWASEYSGWWAYDVPTLYEVLARGERDKQAVEWTGEKVCSRFLVGWKIELAFLVFSLLRILWGWVYLMKTYLRPFAIYWVRYAQKYRGHRRRKRREALRREDGGKGQMIERKSGVQEAGYPQDTPISSSLSTLLSSPKILTLLIHKLHHADVINLLLLSTSTYNSIHAALHFCPPDTLKDNTCIENCSKRCWGCGTSICDVSS